MKITKEILDAIDAVLVYCRVSSERQKKDGHGLESQEHRARTKASEFGLPVEECFKDSFTGGGDFTKRPAMSALIGRLENNPDKRYMVIIDDLKRLARDIEAHMKLRTLLKSHDVVLKCLSYDLDESPEGQFVESVFAAQNELERKQNRRQVIQKQKARLESGYWPFGSPPGYKFEERPAHGKLLVPDERTKDIYARALKRFATGRIANRAELRQFLEEAGIAEIEGTKGVSYNKADRLLKRVVYAGYIEYPDWEVKRRKGHHEPIISLETYNKIQQKLRGDRHTYPERQDNNPDFPARALIVCRACAKPLTGSWSTGRNKKYPYYRCKNKDCDYGGKSVARDELHSDLEKLLQSIEPKPGAVKLSKRIMKEVWKELDENQEEFEERTKQKIQELEKEISELVDKAAAAKSPLVTEKYEKKIDKLSKEQNNLEDSLQHNSEDESTFGTALDEVCGFLESPYSQWKADGLVGKRTVLKLAFEQKPAFHMENGFGTAKESLPLEIFKLVGENNLQDVEMARIELACRHADVETLHAVACVRGFKGEG